MKAPEGPELGRLIQVALQRKKANGTIKSLADVARYFGITTPSIHGWFKHGRISDDKMTKLITFLRDVTTLEDWGFEDWPDWVGPPVTVNDMWRGAIRTNLGLDDKSEEFRKHLTHMFSAYLSGDEPAQAPWDELTDRWNKASPDNQIKLLKIARIIL